MTEGVAPFSATTRDDWRTGGPGAEDVYASAGRAFPTASIRAVGRDGRILGPGEEGELTVQADIMFDGSPATSGRSGCTSRWRPKAGGAKSYYN